MSVSDSQPLLAGSATQTLVTGCASSLVKLLTPPVVMQSTVFSSVADVFSTVTLEAGTQSVVSGQPIVSTTTVGLDAAVTSRGASNVVVSSIHHECWFGCSDVSNDSACSDSQTDADF